MNILEYTHDKLYLNFENSTEYAALSPTEKKKWKIRIKNWRHTFAQGQKEIANKHYDLIKSQAHDAAQQLILIHNATENLHAHRTQQQRYVVTSELAYAKSLGTLYTYLTEYGRDVKRHVKENELVFTALKHCLRPYREDLRNTMREAYRNG